MVEAILQAILRRGETNPKSYRIMAGQNHLLEAKTQN
jgi:hypothetical protein